MKLKTFWLVALCIAALALVTFLWVRPKSTLPEKISPEILERSQGYILKLGSKPENQLSTEDKLILLHSYYNVRRYESVIHLANGMIPELKSLPPERLAPFQEMIKKSYERLGRPWAQAPFFWKLAHAG